MPAVVLPCCRIPPLVRERARLLRQKQRWTYYHRRGQVADANEMMRRIKRTAERLDAMERASE